jgi:hypothetical protein
VNSIPQFPAVQNTPAAQPWPVLDPSRDLSAYWTPPPPTWANALESVAPNINRVIQEQSQSGSTWVDTLQRVLPALATTYQQREILQIQLERARQGLPPLDNSAFGAQVSVGLDSSTRNILMIGGAALIGLLAWRAFKR